MGAYAASRNSRQMKPLVRIESHAVKGKILVATQACHAGQEILREKPVVVVPDNDAMTVYQIFLAQPSAVKVRARCRQSNHHLA